VPGAVGAAAGPGLRRRLQVAAQVEQQLAEAALLGGLCQVVARPVLLVGGLVGRHAGDGLRGPPVVLAGTNQAGGEDVLAGLLAQAEVVTLAGWVGADADAGLGAVGLGGDQAGAAVEGDAGPRGQLQGVELTQVHARPLVAYTDVQKSGGRVTKAGLVVQG